MTGAPTRSGKVGILPMGALGVAFYFHLTRQLGAVEETIGFIERTGSATIKAQRARGSVPIFYDGNLHSVATGPACHPDLLACAQGGWMPEVVLVCTQSDQILPVISSFVELLEWLYAAQGLESAVESLPLLVLCSNGIYYQRVRRFLVETLEESTLYGRLPDLWSQPMGLIVGKLLRGVTMQTGQRQGEGPEAVYHPGPAGLTRLAGGEAADRRRAGQLLQERGGRFDIEEEHSATRVEFDKALVNLFANFLGQFKAIDENGVFRAAIVRDIVPDPESAETREMAHHVIAVGRAVKAYRADEDGDVIYRSAMTVVRGPMEHVPSSIKWIEAQLRAGCLQAQITPTERWLLEPLIQYASHAGLDDSTRYFNGLISQIETRMARAIELQGRNG